MSDTYESGFSPQGQELKDRMGAALNIHRSELADEYSRAVSTAVLALAQATKPGGDVQSTALSLIRAYDEYAQERDNGTVFDEVPDAIRAIDELNRAHLDLVMQDTALAGYADNAVYWMQGNVVAVVSTAAGLFTRR